MTSLPDGDQITLEKEGYAADAMTHLLLAYRAFLDDKRCWPLLDPLMDIIERKRDLITDGGIDLTVVEEEVDKAVVHEAVTKKIVKDGEEWCVWSADGGENYGCYSTEAAAKERLGEIEYFANKNLSGRTTSQLKSLLGRIGKVQNTDAVALEAIVRNEISTRDTYVCKADDERRYTLGPVYVPGQIDAHGEFTDDETLQKALWGWVKKGDRSIRLQHTDKAAGEMVELVTWPWEITTKMSVPGDEERDVSFPAETPFMGVVWEPWAWDLVKAGELRGYSMGGRARRVEAEFVLAP